MSYLFTQTLDDFNGILSKTLAPKLIPTNNEVNVVDSFPWTLTPLNSLAILETPYIKLKEFYLDDNYINQLFKAYGYQITTAAEFAKALGSGLLIKDFEKSKNIYEGLYDHANETGFNYTFPYFSDSYLETSNSWVARPFYNDIIKYQQKVAGYTGVVANTTLQGIGLAVQAGGWLATAIAAARGGARAAPLILQTTQTIADFIKQWGQPAANLLGKGYQTGLEYQRVEQRVRRSLTSPIGGIEDLDPSIDRPQMWNSTVPRSFNVGFPLFNTLTQPNQKNWQEQIVKNWELCYLLTYQNLINKQNLFTGKVPVFYQIDIPGVHFSKAGFIQNLQILNIGNIRALELTINGTVKPVNVPDAYFINFTITDFFMPSKNFMSLIGDPNRNTNKLLQSIGSLQKPQEVTDSTSSPPPVTGDPFMDNPQPYD